VRRGKANQEDREPAQAGGREHEIQDSKPDRGDLVNKRDEQVGIAINSAAMETDQKQQQCSAQGLEAGCSHRQKVRP
jgi:hypothetical protein